MHTASTSVAGDVEASPPSTCAVRGGQRDGGISREGCEWSRGAHACDVAGRQLLPSVDDRWHDGRLDPTVESTVRRGVDQAGSGPGITACHADVGASRTKAAATAANTFNGLI